jgi:hypothetical protein
MKPYLQETQEALQNLLGPDLVKIVKIAAAGPSPDNPYTIYMPDANAAPLEAEDLASKVALSSNAYMEICDLAGKAKAFLNGAEMRYKFKYRSNQLGNNAAEREMAATEASTKEYQEYVIAQQVYDLAQYMEMRARVASETARKLLDKAQSIQIASAREAHGHVKDSDYDAYSAKASAFGW